MEMKIKRVHNLTIVSEKLDTCPPKHADEILFFIAVSTIIFIFAALFMIPPANLFINLAGFLASIIWFLFGCIEYQRMKKCGCLISLRMPNEYRVAVQTYQFTDNPDQDVDEINKIVAGFERIASRVYYEVEAKQEKERDDLTKCCDIYTNVLEKIK